MKVKDLIASLSKLDDSLEVFGYCEDESIATEKHPFRIFFVDGVDITLAVLGRDADRAPMVNFGDGEGSRKLAFINMSADF